MNKQKHQHPGWENQNTGKHKPDLAMICKVLSPVAKPRIHQIATGSCEEKHKRDHEQFV